MTNYQVLTLNKSSDLSKSESSSESESISESGNTPKDKMPDFTGDPKFYDKSSFSESLSGSCLCGAITVTINDNELFTRPRGHLCHCANCRKVGGTFAQANLKIEKEKVKIDDPKGVMKVYDDVGGLSGKHVHRHFCSVDGKYVLPLIATHLQLHSRNHSLLHDTNEAIDSPICSIADSAPGFIILKLGIFPRIPQPEFETFGEHRHDWQGRHPGMKTFKIAAGQEVLYEGTNPSTV